MAAGRLRNYGPELGPHPLPNVTSEMAVILDLAPTRLNFEADMIRWFPDIEMKLTMTPTNTCSSRKHVRSKGVGGCVRGRAAGGSRGQAAHGRRAGGATSKTDSS